MHARQLLKRKLTKMKESEAPVLSIIIDANIEQKEIHHSEPAPKLVATMAIVEKEEVHKPTFEEKIQKVEDLTLLINKYRALAESRRKLQTFQIGLFPSAPQSFSGMLLAMNSELLIQL